MADVLTSYAKVLGDLFVSGCMFLSPGISSTGKPDRNCGGAYMVPLIISIPSMIRLRQCLIEFLRVRNNPNKNASTGWGGCAGTPFFGRQYEDRFDELVQTTPSKCSEVFQRFPSHRSERAPAWDRPTVHRNERSRSFSTLVSHGWLIRMRRLLTDIQVVFRISELLLLLLLGRCQSKKHHAHLFARVLF